MLAAVLIVWRRDLRAIMRLLACQGVALAAIPIMRGVYDGDAALIGVGVAVLALRAASCRGCWPVRWAPSRNPSARPPRW